MTSVGRRPTLNEVYLALHAIIGIEADVDAINPARETFRVVLTFSRERCPEDWRNGQPKPSWLFQQITEELAAWLEQRNREEQWVSKEEQFGASIDTLMVYWHEELEKSTAIRPESMLMRMHKQILSNTIVRLKELKERRDAGGVYSRTESNRDKARKAWMEEEFEAPKREEEQQRRRDARDRAYGFYDYDLGARHQQKSQQTPQSSNERSWYAILGVSAHATKNEIQKAYRALAAKFHPDRYRHTDAHERMAEINTAKKKGLKGL